MAKGVKNIKRLSNSLQPDDYFNSGDIICINPDQEAKFIVGEWYNETTEEERRNTTWLWMDQKKRKTFNKITKPSGVPYGVTLPKKLCGIYAFYLEASLDGQHGQRNTGVYVFGKCENKITSSSWSKKENTADKSEINYGDKLFITLEAEGLNGNTLILELYSVKNDTLLESEKANCIDGTIKATFKMKSAYKEFPGMPEPVEKFYIKAKVIGTKEEYIKDATGSDKILSFNIIKTNSIITIPVFQAPTNTTPLKIDDTPQQEEIKTEGIISAYFAKEEFSLETSEIAGEHEYVFKNPNVNINKDKIAKIIKGQVDAKVKADKKYVRLEDIKNALIEDSYDKGRSVSFNLCKLGAKFIKINSAPLEEEVYVVAKTFLLDGKEVNITIKEKETYLVDENTAVPVLEAKEDGAELTTLKATVENGLAKVKVKLRPKADEDLKIWKEKLLKGKKDGTYSYTFKSDTTIKDDNKKQFATIILNNAKEGKKGNTKIETGKTAFAEDVEKVLVEGMYKSGDTISFDLYKIQTENLWLQAECQGNTEKHEGEFLKRDGEYFVIGKGKCPRCGVLTIDELDLIFTSATKDKKEQLMNAFNLANSKFGLNTCQQKAHFFAQVREEVGLSIDIKDGEGLNYAVEKLTEHYARFSTTGLLNGPPNDLAFTYGRIDNKNINFLKTTYNKPNLTEHSANVQMIANIAYAHNEDNGDVSSGDGWKYRGRGIIQITFKRKYTNINRRITSDYGEYGKAIDANNINDIDEGTVASMAYWKEYGCQSIANKGISRTNFDGIVDIINSKTPSREDRWKHLQKMIDVFKVTECQKDSAPEICTSDCSQCFNYSDVLENPEISSDNGGKKNNRFNSKEGRKKAHRGVDIHTGDNKVDVHSLLCGEVVFIKTSFATNEYNSTSLGNLVVVKSKDKDGETVYIMYCHLDSVKVVKGDKVKHNDVLGISGSTGNAGSVYENGKLIHGIEPKNYHIHIEASTAYVADTATFKNVASSRVNPENYMKTKFDNNGERI